MSTYKILQDLAATRSRNEKEAILQAQSENTELKAFFKLALDPFINFFQKKPFTHKPNKNTTSNLSNAMAFLNTRISTRLVTGNAAIDEINTVLSTLSKDDAKCLMMILQKDPRAGLGISTVNKVWNGLIQEFPCLLATAWDDKLAAKLPWAAGVISQCLSKDWEIEDDLGNRYKISDIVDNRIEINVKSYDENTKSVCYKKVTNFFDNGVSNESWVTIKYEENGIVKTSRLLTKNHKVFSNGNWICVGAINPGDVFF